jgi:hypothetical protein
MHYMVIFHLCFKLLGNDEGFYYDIIMNNGVLSSRLHVSSIPGTIDRELELQNGNNNAPSFYMYHGRLKQ